MSDDTLDVDMLVSLPRDHPSGDDVEMFPEADSEGPTREASTQGTSADLSRLTSLSLTDKEKPPAVYVEVPSLPPQAKLKYATDLKERPITSDEEFPAEEMKSIVGEYEMDGDLHYFVKMTSGIAFKVTTVYPFQMYRSYPICSVPREAFFEEAPSDCGTLWYAPGVHK